MSRLRVLSPTRTLYKILDSCKQLTLAQGAGEEDPSGMVTIVTGFPLDDPSALSGPMQVGLGRQAGLHGRRRRHGPPQHRLPSPRRRAPRSASPSLRGPFPQAALQAAAHASVDVQNVLDFYKQWKEIG